MTPFDIVTATKQEIIDRVAERLRDGKGRCHHNGACRYYREKDGNMCAVGYMLPDPKVLKGSEAPVRELAYGSLSMAVSAPVAEALERHLPLLIRLQRLHDTATHWGDVGAADSSPTAMNERGEGAFRELCSAYGLTYPEKKATTDV
jgi:hypothetical protein